LSDKDTFVYNVRQGIEEAFEWVLENVLKGIRDELKREVARVKAMELRDKILAEALEEARRVIIESDYYYARMYDDCEEIVWEILEKYGISP